MSKYLNIFTFCKIVRGNESAIICDFQKKNIKYIPIELAEVIEKLMLLEYKIVENMFKDQKYIFDSYIYFLISERFAFFSDHRIEFIEMPEDWDSPEIINNAIIEYNSERYNIYDALKQLDELECKFLEIRFLSYFDEIIEELEAILSFISDSILSSVKLFIPFTKKMDIEYIKYIIKNNGKLDKIIVFSSPCDIGNQDDIIFVNENYYKIRNENYKDNDIIIDIEYFMESKKYNPYYNKKVCIDVKGNFKNCLKNRKKFGNINNISIKSMLINTDFKDFWNASPDKIYELKDDELRYNKLVSNDLIRVGSGYKIIP